MDLIQGGELRELLNEHKRFEESVVKFYAAQIIDAVIFLHDKDLVHRDLKLENILVDKEGYLHIIDFGISKKIE
jgi:serine/threonine protein kinase